MRRLNYPPLGLSKNVEQDAILLYKIFLIKYVGPKLKCHPFPKVEMSPPRAAVTFLLLFESEKVRMDDLGLAYVEWAQISS